MKKKVFSVLALCVLLLLSFSACSLDQALDALAGNKYIEWGIAEVDTSASDAAVSMVSEMKKADASSAVSGTSVDVSKIAGFESVSSALEKAGIGTSLNVDGNLAAKIAEGGLLQAQSEGEKTALNNSLSQALAGTASREALVSSLTAEADAETSTAAKNSMALTSSIIVSVVDQIGTSGNDTVSSVIDSIKELQSQLDKKSKSAENLTQAEVLQVQMITNLVTSVAAVAGDDEIKNSSDLAAVLENPAVKDLLDDASILSNTSKALSGDVDILTVPGLTDLLSSAMGGSSSDEGSKSARSGNEGTEDSDSNLVYDRERNAYRAGTPYDSSELTPDDIKSQQDMIQFIRNFLDTVLAMRVSGTELSRPADYSTRMTAFENLSTSYDVIFSVVRGEYEDVVANSSQYSSLGQYTSISKAIDFALATIISQLGSILTDNEMDLYTVLSDFVRLNPWIGRGSMNEGEYYYIPKNFADAFGIAKSDGEDNPFTAVFEQRKEVLLDKSTTLDRMMAVGGFDIQSVLGAFTGGSSGDAGSDVTSVKEWLEDFFAEDGSSEN